MDEALRVLVGPERGWRLAPVIGWLLADARFLKDPVELVGELVRRLRAQGAPISRFRVGIGTLDPQVSAWAVNWTERGGPVYWTGGHDIASTPEYVGSPGQFIRETGRRYRRRLADLTDSDHTLMHELKADGMTDYYGMPMPFSNGQRNMITVATNRPEGFEEDDILKIAALARSLGAVGEILETQRRTSQLLNTYLGPRTGEKVLRGLINRGSGERIRAAFWYSDLRNFTGLSETLPGDLMLELLNDYYELVADAVRPRGGEVLQYVGDAVLLIFPASRDHEMDEACQAALVSAYAAFDQLDVLNAERHAAGKVTFRFGLGLHLGEVLHGNVGSLDRLGFNVVGPAVNRTARLESLTKEAGTPILMSAEFVHRALVPARSMGRFPMRGIEGDQEVFAPMRMLPAEPESA